jgi:autotransporter translocation and assembly factor TamB
MSELTKGPWKAKRLATYQEPGWVVLWPDKGGTHMRRLDSNGNFTGPDAALIAAAHELLAAARKVDALSIQTDAHKELRAAIAKATEHDENQVARHAG